MKRALITGITGQDGSYLAEWLLHKDYIVHGLISSPLLPSSWMSPYVLAGRLLFHQGNLEDRSSLEQALCNAEPNEIYNLGGVSHEQAALRQPAHVAHVNGLGVLHLLELARMLFPKTRFFQASSAELFGRAEISPQTEATPFRPYSPYGVAKLFAHWTVIQNRDMHQFYACNALLFNHESPRRKETFVSRKISRAVARIHKGLQEKLYLGNLNARRDWGYAPDFVEAMWLMLQQNKPDDFVLASGEVHSVREFVELAFREIGVTLSWEASGVNEKGYDLQTGKIRVEVSPDFFRPMEVFSRCGDAAKAREKLGWSPKTPFVDLVKRMVEHDLRMEES